MASLIITRSNEVTNLTVDYSIHINGEEKGTVSNAGKAKIELKTGTHALQIKSRTVSSAIIPIEIEENETVMLHLNMDKTGRWILPIGVGIIAINFVLKQLTENELPAYIVAPSLFAVLLLYVYYRTIGRRKSIKIKRIQ